MAKTKQSNLITCLKMLNIGFIKKCFINLGIGVGGYSVFNEVSANKKAHLTHFLMFTKTYSPVLDETLHGCSLGP